MTSQRVKGFQEICRKRFKFKTKSVKTKAVVYKTDTRIQTLFLKVRKFSVLNSSCKNKFFANIPKLSLKGLQNFLQRNEI
jgi:hypothetical protein